MEPTETDRLTAKFRTAALEKATLPGGKRDGVLYADMSDAFDELLRQGEIGNVALEKLLVDSSPDVRGWIAAQFLYLGRLRARPILEKLANGTGLVASSAQITLQQFDAGLLGSPLGHREQRSG